MNEKSNDEILSQKLMKLQRNSRRGLLLFLLGFIGVVCTLVGWLFGQGEENKLPILLFTAVLLEMCIRDRSYRIFDYDTDEITWGEDNEYYDRLE